MTLHESKVLLGESETLKATREFPRTHVLLFIIVLWRMCTRLKTNIWVRARNRSTTIEGI